jgi:hypothetical protein
MDEARQITPLPKKERDKIFKRIGNNASQIAEDVSQLKKSGIIEPEWIEDFFSLMFESQKKNKIFCAALAGVLHQLDNGDSSDTDLALLKLIRIGQSTPQATKYGFDSFEFESDFDSEKFRPDLQSFFSTLAIKALNDSKKEIVYKTGNASITRNTVNFQARFFSLKLVFLMQRLFDTPLYQLVADVTNIVFTNTSFTEDSVKMLANK